ncbi:restriction endonuclease subunit S [Fructobacillus cardui]|uniref:Restriction endonuclease S subunit (HsdS) n=1 Tax=Fructobacillus cardui TaxID=2893170 RepID=A0ABM9MVY5_9LACO|nr:Restriction endonuclease S subunit (HsdS) [Fructobacillus cardui]
MNKNVPEIRFQGFHDDWEQRKLGDFLKIFDRKSTIDNEYTVLSSTNSGMEYRQGRVSSNSNKGYKIIEIGDLVLSPQNLWLGNININNLSVGLVSPSYKTFKFINVNPGFIRPQLKLERMLWNYKSVSTQGASVVRRNLELDGFYKIKLLVPKHNEQNQLEKLFATIDNLITLHQRKLNLLQEQKKSLLQKMFPKKDEKIPEIRFNGFTDDWEQRKFDSLVKRVAKTSEENLPSVEYDDVISGYGKLNKNVALKGNNRKGILFQEDDILFGKLRPYLKNWLIADFKGIAIGDWWVFRSNINSQFTYTLIQTKQYETISNLSTGTKMPRSDWKIVANSEFRVPINNVEQTKVGTLFKKLDNLITLHQRKLDALQEQKKGLLQKMFV